MGMKIGYAAGKSPNKTRAASETAAKNRGIKQAAVVGKGPKKDKFSDKQQRQTARAFRLSSSGH